MAFSKTKERGLGIVLQYAQMGLNIIIQLVYIPIMLKILGSVEYGIYNVAASTVSYLSLLSFGFGASYIRYYNITKTKGNEDEINNLNGLYLLVFTIIGLIALCAGLFLTINVDWFYNETYSANDISIARVLMFLLTINLAISFPASVFTSFITSQERFVFQKIVNMGKSLVGPALRIVALYLGYRSIGMALCTTVISLIVDGINIWFCFKKIGMKISLKHPDFRLLKEIFAFSAFIGINSLIDQINWQTDKIILSKVVNGTAVAIYVVGAQINSMFINFSTAISSVFAPKINAIVSANEPDMDTKLTALFIKIGRIQWFILALILSGFIFFGKFFVLKWAGAEYGNSYYVALLLLSPVIIPLMQNLGIEIQQAKNKHQFRSIVYLLMALANVGISIYFAHLWGEIGVALGTTISLLIANGLIMNIYYYKWLNIDVLKFWKSLLSTIPGLILPILLGVCLMKFYSFVSLLDFVLLIFGYTIIYCLSIYFLSINKEEKSVINGLLKRFFLKNKNGGHAS